MFIKVCQGGHPGILHVPYWPQFYLFLPLRTYEIEGNKQLIIIHLTQTIVHGHYTLLLF